VGFEIILADTYNYSIDLLKLMLQVPEADSFYGSA
jgi:hypothetical protein